VENEIGSADVPPRRPSKRAKAVAAHDRDHLSRPLPRCSGCDMLGLRR